MLDGSTLTKIKAEAKKTIASLIAITTAAVFKLASSIIIIIALKRFGVAAALMSRNYAN